MTDTPPPGVSSARKPYDGADTSPLWIRLKRRLNFSDKQRRRYLSHRIETVAGRLDVARKLASDDRACAARCDATAEALEEARRGLAVEHNNHALFALHEARRLFLGLQSEDERAAKAASLRSEVATPQFAEVEPAIANQLATVAEAHGEGDADRALAFLVSAMEIRDGVIEAQFISKSRLAFILAILGVLLVATTATVLLAFADYCFALPGDGPVAFRPCDAETDGTVEPIWIIAVLGALGGTLSSMMGFAFESKVPDLFTSVSITVVRPVIGAVSGLIGLCVMALGIIDIGGSMAALFLIIVAFGFSERLVLGAINRVDFRR